MNVKIFGDFYDKVRKKFPNASEIEIHDNVIYVYSYENSFPRKRCLGEIHININERIY